MRRGGRGMAADASRHDRAMKADRPTPWMLASLAAIPFVMVLGNSMIIPVLPRMKQEMNVTQLEIGLLITAFSVPGGLAIPFAGFLADRFGRRPVIIPSLALYALGGVVAGLAAWLMANPYPVVFGGRVIQGLGAAGTGSVAIAMAGDLYQSKARSKAVGVLEAANNLGKVIAPILGVIAALIVWWAPFWAYPILILPAALGVWLVLRERHGGHEDKGLKPYLGDVWAVFRSKGKSLFATVFAGTVVLFTWFGLLFFFSDALEREIGQGLRQGFIFAGPVLAMSLVSYGSGTLMQRRLHLLKVVIVIGFALLAAALASLVFIPVFWYLFVAVALLGVASGIILPQLNTAATSAAKEDERGAVTAVYSALRFFGAAMGPPVFGLLMEGGRGLMFGLAAGIGAVAGALAWLLIDVRKLLPSKFLEGRPPRRTDAPMRREAIRGAEAALGADPMPPAPEFADGQPARKDENGEAPPRWGWTDPVG